MLLAIAGGALIGTSFQRRIDDDHAQRRSDHRRRPLGRIPVRGADDDLDRLAATFNRMLDRIRALMESLRQVSNDIAHDLRTPLTRLRQRLEASAPAATRTAEREAAIDGALEDVDGILDTFAALLRIAQIEGGARARPSADVDLRDPGPEPSARPSRPPPRTPGRR